MTKTTIVIYKVFWTTSFTFPWVKFRSCHNVCTYSLLDMQNNTGGEIKNIVEDEPEPCCLSFYIFSPSLHCEHIWKIDRLLSSLKFLEVIDWYPSWIGKIHIRSKSNLIIKYICTRIACRCKFAKTLIHWLSESDSSVTLTILRQLS